MREFWLSSNSGFSHGGRRIWCCFVGLFSAECFSSEGLVTKCQRFGIAARLCLRMLTSCCWETSHSCVKLILLRIPYLCSTNVRSWKRMFLTLLQAYFDRYNLFQKKLCSKMFSLSLCFAFPLLLWFACREAHRSSHEKETASSCTRGRLG